MPTDTMETDFKRDESVVNTECVNCPALLSHEVVEGGRVKVKCALCDALSQMKIEDLKIIYPKIAKAFLGQKEPLLEEYRQLTLENIFASNASLEPQVVCATEGDEGQEKSLPQCEALKRLEAFTDYVVKVRNREIWIAEGATYRQFSKGPKGF